MKYLINDEKTICGVSYSLFSIVIMKKGLKYRYYVKSFKTSNVGDRMIYKSNLKSKFLNKYTLSLLGAIYSILEYIVIWPFVIISTPIWMYVVGANSFIRNSSWTQHERYFNMCNIIIIFILTTILFFKF